MFSWLTGRSAGSGEQANGHVTAEALKAELSGGSDLVVLDVRQPEEFRSGCVPGARHIPLPQLARRLNELDRECDLVVYCHSGMRSALACAQLRRAGFSRVRNLRGGMMSWARARG